MKLSRHKFIRRLLNYYRRHFDIESPFVILIDGTFAFEALQWKIQIDEQLKSYLETDQIICSTISRELNDGRSKFIALCVINIVGKSGR